MKTARMVTAWGETRSIPAWSQDPRCRWSIPTIWKRLKYLSPEDAISGGRLITQTHKKCPDCPKSSYQPFSAFYKSKSGSYGLSPYCKKHTAIRMRAYRQRRKLRESSTEIDVNAPGCPGELTETPDTGLQS